MTDAVTAKADQLRSYGLDTALRLRRTAKLADPEDQATLLALAHRITRCNATRNTWIAADLHNHQTGEMFDGFGRHWQCNSKMCAFCVRENSRRNRKVLRAAIARQKLRVGEHFRFITLTIPNLGLDVPGQRYLVNRAWSLMRKRLWFRRSVVGGAKAEEFTETRSGNHYHLHIVGVTKSIRVKDLKEVWTDCVATVFEEEGHTFNCPTSDGLLHVNVQLVRDLNQVVHEVCKYITKSTTWTALRDDHFNAIALVEHWHRMFDVFGSFRNISEKAKKEPSRYLSDADGNQTLFAYNERSQEPRNNWRILIKQMPLEAYIRRLDNEIDETIKRRSEILQLKFPWATITTLEDYHYVPNRTPS